MKISIITPAWNSADTICDTIASVIDQTYNDIELILVDRGSKDETLSIFLSMRHSMDINRTKHISGDFKDVFQAIEKGVEMASGDVITILGAGDFYSSDDVLSSVMEEFSKGDTQMVYGDIKFVDSENTQKVTRRTCGRFYRRWPKTSGMTKCHPALFITKDLFLKNGGFKKDFKLAADYEMMVRLLSNRDLTRKYLRKEIVSIRQDKVNSASAEAYRKELLRASEVNENAHTSYHPQTHGNGQTPENKDKPSKATKGKDEKVETNKSEVKTQVPTNTKTNSTSNKGKSHKSSTPKDKDKEKEKDKVKDTTAKARNKAVKTKEVSVKANGEMNTNSHKTPSCSTNPNVNVNVDPNVDPKANANTSPNANTSLTKGKSSKGKKRSSKTQSKDKAELIAHSNQ